MRVRGLALLLLGTTGCVHAATPTATAVPPTPPPAPLPVSPAPTAVLYDVGWQLRSGETTGWAEAPLGTHAFTVGRWECALGEVQSDDALSRTHWDARRTRRLACTHASGATVRTQLTCNVHRLRSTARDFVEDASLPPSIVSATAAGSVASPMSEPSLANPSPAPSTEGSAREPLAGSPAPAPLITGAAPEPPIESAARELSIQLDATPTLHLGCLPQPVAELTLRSREKQTLALLCADATDIRECPPTAAPAAVPTPAPTSAPAPAPAPEHAPVRAPDPAP